MLLRFSLLLLPLVVLSLAARADEGPSLNEALALEKAMQEAIRRAEPSVACILVTRSSDRGDIDRLSRSDSVPESYGSGVVIDRRGLILTNYHVVRDTTRIVVRLPGQDGCDAILHAIDPYSDLAVLRFDSGRPVQPVKLGDGDHLRKGQLVISLANPFAAGFADGSSSASWGIVSNLRRKAPGRPPATETDISKKNLHHYGTLVQTDARLNFGCSGGALIDLKGELVGLTTAQAALTGSETTGGFAIPINEAMRRIVEVLRSGKEVEYGFLGIRFSQRTNFSDEFVRGKGAKGVRIGGVISGSPAAQAGLRDGDVILSVDGMPLGNMDDMFWTIGTRLAGARARLEMQPFARGGIHTVDVTLAKLYIPGPVTAAHRPPDVRGLRVDYTSVLLQKGNTLGEMAPGVFVREVLPGSSADRAHLQDAVITHVNGEKIDTPADFYRLAEGQAGPLELTLLNRDEHGSPKKVKLN